MIVLRRVDLAHGLRKSCLHAISRENRRCAARNGCLGSRATLRLRFYGRVADDAAGIVLTVEPFELRLNTFPLLNKLGNRRR